MLPRRRFLLSALSSLASTMVSPSLARERTSARAEGYFVPREDVPHKLTLMQWPTTMASYDDRQHLDAMRKALVEIANTIAEFEPVVMLMDREHKPLALQLLSGAVEIWDIPTDDIWCRDCGPVFVVDSKGNLAVTHLNFNGWGYRWPHLHDGKVARRVADRLGLHLFDNGVVGEGGGVETDGEGTLIAHESSWVNPNRNSMTRDAIEQKLLEAYGAKKMIWVPGLVGHDETDYHIDGLVRFVKPGQIVIQIGEKMWPGDAWSRANFESYGILRNATDARNRKLEIVKLPEPDLTDWVSTYVNYYVCNGGVIASQTRDLRANEKARTVLAELYPGREIITLDTDILGRNGGGIHCATQPMPEV